MALSVLEGSEREQGHLLSSQPAFSHFLCYPQANWALWFWFLGGWVCVRSRTLWSLQRTLLWGWEFPATSIHTGLFSQRLWGFIFLCWHPGSRSLSCSPVVPPGFSTCKCWAARSASHHLAGSPFHPRCPSLPLLLVSMNVSSLTPWLLDFNAVWFSGSSGIFCFKICCYPSVGFVIRQSVSTYASILVGSLLESWF